MADQGQDLIFLTGAPGSGWSAVARILSIAAEINKSDVDADKIYIGGKGFHQGTYFGPYQQFGKEFDRLDELSKDEILSEFRKAYHNFNGIKILKSHHFAYHLDFLYKQFPKARYILVFRNSVEATYDWWHLCGGWDITHPLYHWYENNDRMKKQIGFEHAAIQKFIEQQKCRVYNEVFDIRSIFRSLHLTFTENEMENIPFPVSEEFKQLSTQEKFCRFRFGTSLSADPLLHVAIL